MVNAWNISSFPLLTQERHNQGRQNIPLNDSAKFECKVHVNTPGEISRGMIVSLKTFSKPVP